LALFYSSVAYYNYTRLNNVQLSNVMSNESEHKEDESKKSVSLTASKADFKNRKHRFGTSLTLREYEELSAKDPQALTPSEQKSLAEAQQQAHKVA
jgi:hypothetical protein